MEKQPGDVTQLLLKLKAGDRAAEEILIPLVYSELRRIASIRLRNESAHHSLQPTALVNEAYMRLTRLTEMNWQSRSHFFAVSSKLMRDILVDSARATNAKRRGAGMIAITISDVDLPTPGRNQEILALDDALSRLEQLDGRKSKVVELRFFGGLTEEEISEVLHIAPRTVKRDWRAARAWLFAELHG